jgi:hypothetical protein
MSLKHLIVATALVFCLLGGSSAQEPAKIQNADHGLALEVTFLPGTAPAYQMVTRTEAPKGGTWYTRFGRVAGWRLPAGHKPISAVRVVPYLEDDKVRVVVSLLRGKFHEVEETVATYHRRENAELTVAELKDFGIQPFGIKVVRIGLQITDISTTVNRTRALQVVGIEPMMATFPRYKVTLHNQSDKNISALSIYVVDGGKRRLITMPQGKQGEPLIKAKDSYELKQYLPPLAQPAPQGYTPGFSPSQQIVIESLVYEDGTYEGEAEPAATYLGFTAGRKTELKRIVPVLESALASSASLEELRLQLTSLSYDIDDAELAALVEGFPGFDRMRLKSPIETAIHGVRKELVDNLDRFHKDQYRTGTSLEWLTRTRDVYTGWLSRLSAQKIAR